MRVESEVLDGLTGIPSVTVASIIKSEADEEHTEAELVAVEGAIAAARAKAERMAVAMGKTLGDAISVSDSTVNDYGLYSREAAFYSAEMSDGVSVGGSGPPGLLTVLAEAVVVYAFV